MKEEKNSKFHSSKGRNEIVIKWVSGAFIIGLLYWVLDAGVDYLIFYEDYSFAELLFGPFPSLEIYIRLVIIFLFVVFGYFFARIFARQQQTKEKLEHINHALHLLSRLNRYLVRINDEQELLDKICRLFVEEGDYDLAWIGYMENGQESSFEQIICVGGTQEGEKVQLAEVEKNELQQFASEAISKGKTAIRQNIELPIKSVQTENEAADKHIRSVISLRIMVEGENIGTLTLCSRNKYAFDEQEMTLLKELTDDLSFGIQTIRLTRKHEEGMRLLSENEQKYRTLIRNIPNADVYLFDTDMRFIAAEGAEMSRFDRDSDYWINKTLKETLETDTYEFLRPLYEQALNGKRAKKEFPYGGQYYLIQTAPILGEDGEVTGGLAFNQNITSRKYAEQAKLESEEKFKTIFNNANDAIYLHQITEDGKPGKFTEVNDVACSILGYSREELLRLTPLDINKKVDDRNIIAQLEESTTATFEVELLAKDGTVVSMEISSQLFYMGDRRRILSIARDIRDRKQMEATLKQEQELLHKLMNNIPDTIYFKNTSSEFTRINKAQEVTLGVKSPEDAIGKTDFDYFPYEHAEEAYNEEQHIFKTGEPIINKVEQIRRADGELIWMMTTKVPLWDEKSRISGLVGLTRNINRRKIAEENLQEALQEKEVLLRELYHRTKNNMQVIQSMLQLQMIEEEDEHIKEVFTETSNRINTMSLVHQKLYQSQNLSSIDMGEFISELSELILSSYPKQGEKVVLDKQMESVDVTIDTAVPLGLVFNELITNIMKHAFTDLPEGNIMIELCKKDRQIYLTVADNGVGFPENDLPDSRNSMGLGTIYSIVKNQLHGTINYDLEDGVKWSIVIKDELFSKRV